MVLLKARRDGLIHEAIILHGHELIHRLRAFMRSQLKKRVEKNYPPCRFELWSPGTSS